MSPESAQFLMNEILPNITIPVTAPDFTEVTAKFSMLRKELADILEPSQESPKLVEEPTSPIE